MARGDGGPLQLERLVSLARQLLVIPIDEAIGDLWLWEHSERVMRLAQLVASLPDLAAQSPDRTALTVATLFHDAGWTVEFHQGKWKRWQLLSRPTNDIQRELGAAMLQEEASHLLPNPVLHRATQIIRQCNDRRAELVEAHILAEAEALDEVGTMYALRQFRLYQAEGRPLQQLVDTWQRQKEYHYWELRLNDGFRFEMTRALARRRLAALDAFFGALASDLHGQDVHALLAECGALNVPEVQ